MKIVIPGHPDKKAVLAGDIMTRAAVDGEQSPIKVLITKEVADKVAAIQQKTKQANEFRRQSEVLIEERDNLVKDVEQFIRSCRDILGGLYPNEPKKLTEYGFEVDETAAKAKVTQK